MKFSDVKNRETYCVTTGQFIGNIDRVYIDRTTKEVVYIGCSNTLISPMDINGINDIITVVSVPVNRDKVDLTTYLCLKSGTSIYDCKGVKLGEDYDYPIISSYKNQRVISIGESTYDLDKIVSCKDVLFINTGRQLPLKRSNAKEDVESPTLNKPTIKKDEFRQDYNFLIGRITKQNIVDINGNLIVKLGTVITPTVIEHARLNGKLSELVTISR